MLPIPTGLCFDSSETRRSADIWRTGTYVSLDPSSIDFSQVILEISASPGRCDDGLTIDAACFFRFSTSTYGFVVWLYQGHYGLDPFVGSWRELTMTIWRLRGWNGGLVHFEDNTARKHALVTNTAQVRAWWNMTCISLIGTEYLFRSRLLRRSSYYESKIKNSVEPSMDESKNISLASSDANN